MMREVLLLAAAAERGEQRQQQMQLCKKQSTANADVVVKSRDELTPHCKEERWAYDLSGGDVSLVRNVRKEMKSQKKGRRTQERSKTPEAAAAAAVAENVSIQEFALTSGGQLWNYVLHLLLLENFITCARNLVVSKSAKRAIKNHLKKVRAELGRLQNKATRGALEIIYDGLKWPFEQRDLLPAFHPDNFSYIVTNVLSNNNRFRAHSSLLRNPTEVEELQRLVQDALGESESCELLPTAFEFVTRHATPTKHGMQQLSGVQLPPPPPPERPQQQLLQPPMLIAVQTQQHVSGVHQFHHHHHLGWSPHGQFGSPPVQGAAAAAAAPFFPHAHHHDHVAVPQQHQPHREFPHVQYYGPSNPWIGFAAPPPPPPRPPLPPPYPHVGFVGTIRVGTNARIN